MGFIPDKAMNAVSLRETIDQTVSVLINPFYKV